jgi:chromosome segregation ATPase
VSSASSKEASLASANTELQATVARLRDAAAAADAAASSEHAARTAAEHELAAIRSATHSDSARVAELQAAADAAKATNTRISEDNSALKGACARACLCCM